MTLPFTTEQFLNVFAAYNLSVWPMQVALLALAATVVYLAAGGRSYAGRGILVILASLWMWMGAVYQLMFFTDINKAAWLFGILMIAQGAVFLYQSIFHGSVSFRWKAGVYGTAAAAIMVYALLVYPVLGMMFGHGYPHSPTFGLPCPTTIFTFGVVLLSERRIPFWTMLIPLLWSVLGFTAATSLGIKEDIGLLAAGVIAAVMIVMKNRALRAGAVGFAA